MSKKNSQHLVDVNDDAEGSPDAAEQQEPLNPLRTLTMPVLDAGSVLSAGETGVVRTVNDEIEGTDNDESQDASLTDDETRLSRTPLTKVDKQSFDDIDTPILVIEDTVELGEVIVATLEGIGLDARHETHGEKGLATMKTLNPPLVLLDIGLPDMSGWQILEKMKAHYSDDATLPTIIIITAYSDPANRLIGKLQKIHSYLIKPFTPDEVEQVVGMALRGEIPDHPTFGGE